MTINPVFLKYTKDNFQDIFDDYKNITSKVSGKTPDEPEIEIFSNKEKEKSSSLLGKKDFMHAACIMAILTGPEDLRDIMSAYEQIKKGFPEPKSYHSGYNNKFAQHPFSLFRGSILGPYLNPYSEDCPNKKIAMKLIEMDKTIWDTRFGKWVKKKLNIEIDGIITKIEDMFSTHNYKSYVEAKVIMTDNPIKDIIARVMLRTPILSVAALGVVKAVDVINEVKKGKDLVKEVEKSIGTTVVATGVFGAIGAKHYGPTGSLVGITLGSLTGKIVDSVLSDKII